MWLITAVINEEVDNTSEALKAIKKRKEALDWKKGIELDKSLDPDATAQEAIEKLTQLDQSYQMIVAEEKMFQKKTWRETFSSEKRNRKTTTTQRRTRKSK